MHVQIDQRGLIITFYAACGFPLQILVHEIVVRCVLLVVLLERGVGGGEAVHAACGMSPPPRTYIPRRRGR